VRLLVTGASGYLGRALLDAAPATWEVAGTRLSAPGDGPVLDVRDEEAVRRLFDVFRPDCVIHTAYVQHGPAMRDVNVAGSRNVAGAAAAIGARLLHLSTDVVFNGEREGLWREDDETSPITDYGRSKADAEREVLRIAPDALVVRTSLLYGGAVPAPHERLVLDAADGRSQTRFFTDEIRCPIAVGDLADALLELARRREAGAMHVAGPVATSRHAFAQVLARAGGRDPELVRPGRSADLGVARPRNCALDSSRAFTLLKTVVREPREVLR
jgi:dTDP-4-dehydrorhamnose reductase